MIQIKDKEGRIYIMKKNETELNVSTKLLLQIFYESKKWSYKNLCEKATTLLEGAVANCYKQLGEENTFTKENFVIQVSNVMYVKVVCISIKRSNVIKKIILRFGREHSFMDDKRYHFVMVEDIELLFYTVPPKVEYIPHRDGKSREYYLLDGVGEFIDEEDNDVTEYLREEEEKCVLLDFTYCVNDAW